MDRSLAAGATSGSISAIALQLLASALDSSPTPFDCPSCPELAPFWEHLALGHLDLPSVGFGLLLGLLIGPVLDLVNLVRQSWKVWLRSRLLQLGEEKPLYKLA